MKNTGFGIPDDKGNIFYIYGTYNVPIDEDVKQGDLVYYYYNSSEDFGYTIDKNNNISGPWAVATEDFKDGYCRVALFPKYGD